MSEAIIVAIIVAVTNVFSVVWTNKKTNRKLDKQDRDSRRNEAKQSILQMMMEDKVDYYHNRRIPENYNRIHEEYDVYHANGGNGLMTKKVIEHDKWYEEIAAQMNINES